VTETVAKSASRYVAMLFGILTGLGHLDHGILEATQGVIPTNGPLINAVPIGNSWSIWKEGGEAAFTVFPSMLSAGVASVLVGLAVIFWSVAFLHRNGGPFVYLGLCVVSLLTGGGIGQIVFFTVIFAFSTRVGKPLSFWKKAIPHAARARWARLWKVLAVLAVLFFLISLELAILGYFPLTSEPSAILAINWSFLLASLLLMIFAFISAFADDLRRREPSGVAAEQRLPENDEAST
jgi:hypothetical protein